MSNIYHALFYWLPTKFVVLILGFLAIAIVIAIFRIVKMVLDALPFV